MTETAARPPQVGHQAPNFTLHSTAGERVTLTDYREKKNVLIAFFPLAFTSTCTEEVCAFSEDFDVFAGKDVVVLPISVDSVPTLKAYRQKYHLKGDLLSDFKREASRAYGVLRDDTFYSNRAYFLLDKSGIVKWAHVEDPPRMRRQNLEIFTEIEKLAAID